MNEHELDENEFTAYLREHAITTDDLPFFCALKCPDQKIGQVDFTVRNCKLWLPRQARLLKQKEAASLSDLQQSIVLIIESPHKDEFTDRAFIAPAMGKTGEYLAAYLPKLLHMLLLHHPMAGSYALVLMNTIQYQCSLGEVPTKFRDRIWRDLWERLADDFIARLKSYRASIVFEMCTSSDGRKQLVQNRLKREISCPIFITTHPCSWWQAGNRHMRELPRKTNPDD